MRGLRQLSSIRVSESMSGKCSRPATGMRLANPNPSDPDGVTATIVGAGIRRHQATDIRRGDYGP